MIKQSNIDKNYLWIVIASVLLIGLSARLLSLTVDKFGLYYDDYALMKGVEQSFFHYLSSFSGSYTLSQVIPYWLVYRLFGNHIYGYLVLPVTVSIATLIVVYWGIKKIWNISLLSFFILLILTYNHHFLWLSEYAMLSYISSLFVSTCLYFLFLYLSGKIFTKKKLLWISLSFIPMALISNIVLIIPIISGIISVWIYSLNNTRKKSDRKLIIFFKDLIIFAIFPIVYIIAYQIYPYTNIGFEKRPDMAAFFYYSSKYAYNFFGAILFLLNNSIQLFHELLSFSLPSPILENFLIIISIIGAIYFFINLILKKIKDIKIHFTLLYLGITFALIAIGGVFGLYPFGGARYASYILVPTVILISYGDYLFFGNIGQIKLFQNFRIYNNYKISSIIISIIIIILGGYVNLNIYKNNYTNTIINNNAFTEINQINADLILYSSNIAPALYIRMRDKYDLGYNIGWETEIVSNNVAKQIEGISRPNNIKINTILLISQPATLDRITWNKFIGNSFQLTYTISAPSVWAAYYNRKI